MDTHLDVGSLQEAVSLPERAVDLGLDLRGLADQVHDLTHKNVSFLIHQIEALFRKCQRILGQNQISLGGKCVWIHTLTSDLCFCRLRRFIEFIKDLGIDTVKFFSGQHP